MLGEVGFSPAQLAQLNANDAQTVRRVCSVVSDRAIQLVAAALSTVAARVQADRVCVACDGSLLRGHPQMADKLTAWTKEFAPTKQVC